MEIVEKVRKPTTKWDAHATNVFNEICVQQVSANNRPNGCLNNRGYANLMAQFNERTGRNYSRAQLKNRWDALKADYTTWKTLNLHASGLGRDPKTSTIATDAAWWVEKIAAIPECQKFRFAPLEDEDDLEIMFTGATCTNESAMVPGVDDVTQKTADVGDAAGEASLAATSIVNRQAKKRVMQVSPPNKSKKNFRYMQFKRLVDIFVEKVTNISMPHNYSSRKRVFSTLKTPGGKLAWLRRTWEERKKH